MKSSNPKRNVPHRTRSLAEWTRQTHPTGPAMLGDGGDGMRSRSDFAGASTRKESRGEKVPVAPRPPPAFELLEDLNDDLDAPAPVYGQYPRGLIAKLLPWLQCERREIVHVCSGALPRGEGIRVDIRPDAKPDVLADGRALPFADGSVAAVMIDPPYCEEYARSLYGVEYPRPSHLLAEAARVVRPCGRIAIVHYITPSPAPGTFRVKAFGLGTGANMPMRAVVVFEREQARLL